MISAGIGFLAAALKHKWDVQDDDARWERERAERRRDELRAAFSAYLSARWQFDLLDRTGKGVTTAYREAAHGYATAFNGLSVVLVDEELKATVRQDYEGFIAWYQSAPEKRALGEDPGMSPAAGKVIDLASELLR